MYYRMCCINIMISTSYSQQIQFFQQKGKKKASISHFVAFIHFKSSPPSRKSSKANSSKNGSTFFNRVVVYARILKEGGNGQTKCKEAAHGIVGRGIVGVGGRSRGGGLGTRGAGQGDDASAAAAAAAGRPGGACGPGNDGDGKGRVVTGVSGSAGGSGRGSGRRRGQTDVGAAAAATDSGSWRRRRAR